MIASILWFVVWVCVGGVIGGDMDAALRKEYWDLAKAIMGIISSFVCFGAVIYAALEASKGNYDKATFFLGLVVILRITEPR